MFVSASSLISCAAVATLSFLMPGCPVAKRTSEAPSSVSPSAPVAAGPSGPRTTEGTTRAVDLEVVQRSVRIARQMLPSYAQPERASPGMALNAARAARACEHHVAGAIAAGTAPSHVVEDSPPVVTLGAARETVCAPLGVAARAARDAVVAGHEGELARYSAALTGDRLRIARDELLFAADVRGIIDGRLTTFREPVDFADAAVWHEVWTDRTSGREWAIRRFRFDGDRLLGVDELRGPDVEPPEQAFR